MVSYKINNTDHNCATCPLRKKNVFYRYKDTPDDRADIAIALLAAAKANHVNIIDIILRKDDDAFQDERKSSVLHVVDEVSHFPIWKVAVFEGLSCIFEVRS